MVLPVSILILAAGASVRYGQAKQLLPFRGRTLLHYMAEVALSSRAHHVHVILGSDADRMVRELTDLPVRRVINNDWREGLSSSIRTGIRSLSPSDEGALLLLCDQPLITTEILNTIIAAFTTSKQIIAAEYYGTVGVPALFGKAYFPELLLLSGDRGAKEILREHASSVHTIPFPDAAFDIDTVADYQHLQRREKELR